MSTTTQLLCTKFGGIRQRNAVFNDELITAQDMQNTELYYTGVNGGIGIRTTKGNELVKAIGENIVGIYESVQNEKTLTLIYTEPESKKGGLYFNKTTLNFSRYSSLHLHITYGNGKFILASNNGIEYSLDGKTWVKLSLFDDKETDFRRVAYGNGKFIAFGDIREDTTRKQIIAYSEDGITWNKKETDIYPSALTYGNDKFVVLESGSSKYYYSEDGINWIESNLPTSAQWISLTYGDEKFVAVAYRSNISIYSEDGINWTETTLPDTIDWVSVCYGDGKFVAVALDSAISAYSTDGINWVQTNLPTSFKCRSICYGDGKFIVIGDNSSYSYYSEDGINWGKISMHSTENWVEICYGNKFVIVSSGKALYSSNGGWNNNLNGRLYLYYNKELTLISDNIKKTGKSNGFDVAQGWRDYFFFTTGEEMYYYEAFEYKNNDYTSTLANTLTKLDVQDRDGRDVIGLGACLFDNRLCIFNKNVLWYSVQENIKDFGGNSDSTNGSTITTTGGYIETTKDITAIHEYAGSLAIFYKDSSQLLSVSDGAFTLGDASTGGCAGRNALVFHDTDLYFYDDTKKSVFSFKQIVTGEKTLGENIAVEVQEELQNISGDLDCINALSVFIEDRNEIWWVLPNNSSNYSTILIYDYLKGEWTKRKSQKLNDISVINGKLYSADTKGNLLEEYKTDRFNGEFIEHYYKCSPMNLGAMNTLKVLVFQPRVSFDLPYNNKFYVKYIKNFNTHKRAKVKYIKTKMKNLLDWDVNNWDEKYWQDKNTGNIGKFPNATFKVLEIEVYTQEEEGERANQNFAIKSIEFSKIKVKQV